MLASKRNLNWGIATWQLGEKNPNFKGGQYIDDKGYVRVRMQDHPSENHGYVYMHRLVLEKALGRYLEPWEIGHHINELKLDNRIENLYLTTSTEHAAIHREGKKASKESREQKSIIAKKRNGQKGKDGRFQKM